MVSPEQIQQTISILNQNRETLGHETVDIATATLHQELSRLQSDRSISQQRKLVSVLFVDVVSSTKTFEKLDPEDVLAIMDEALRVFGKSIERHGGFVARLFGDALLAFFGAPISHENDAERAIRAGLDIIADAKREAEKITRKYPVEKFQVRVGINTGLVALGEVGGAGMEYTAMGDAINVAKHVESAAPVGKLLISHDTYRHVRGIFDVDEHEPMKFKGRTELTNTYVVHFAKPRGFYITDRTVEGIEISMVGRDEDLQTLKDVYSQSIEQHETHLVTVTGNPGMGKSRLLTEFDLWVEALSGAVRYFTAMSLPQRTHTSFGVFHDTFCTFFDIHETDSVQDSHQKLEAGLMQFVDEEHAHIIGELIGFDYADSLHITKFNNDGQLLHDVGYRAIAEFFMATTQYPINEDDGPPQNTVLFIEDIQWADASSLELIQYLVNECVNIPLVVICMARPALYDRVADWGTYVDRHTHIDLKPLSPLQSEALLQNILRKAAYIPPSLGKMIVSNAEGSPYYIEEIIKMLIEEGIIITSEDQWWIEESLLKNVKVPPTVTGVVQARIDRLPPAERQLLQQAAVIGNVFWDASLAMLESDNEINIGVPPAFLEDLQNHELIQVQPDSAFVGVGEYTFRSAILREVVYDSVLRRERRKYHTKAAEWLESTAGERRPEFISIIAQHYAEADQHDKAIALLQEAVELALHLGDMRVAIQDMGRILELMPNDASPIDRIALKLKMVKACLKIGNLQEAEKRLQAGLIIARQLNNPSLLAKILLHLGEVQTKAGKYAEARAYLEEALPLARESSDAEAIAMVLMRTGTLAKHQGRYAEALTAFKESKSLFDIINMPSSKSRVLRKTGIVLRLQGDLEAAKLAFEASHEIYQKLGNTWGIANVLNSLGELARKQQDYTQAEKYYQASLALAEQISNHQLIAILYLNLGHVAAAQTENAKAKDLYFKAVRQAKHFGLKPIKIHAVAGLAGLLKQTGDIETAFLWLTIVKADVACNSRVLHTAEPIYQDLLTRLSQAQVMKITAKSESIRVEEIVRDLLLNEGEFLVAAV